MLPAYNPIQHLPPPTNTPHTLTVSSKGRAYLGTALRLHLGLKADQAINLLVPSNGSELGGVGLGLQFMPRRAGAG